MTDTIEELLKDVPAAIAQLDKAGFVASASLISDMADALRASQRLHDRACDSAYAAGMLSGWNYAQRNDDEGFNEHRLRMMVACGEDRREQKAEEALRAAQQPRYPACKGRNCNATDGVSHSQECLADHEAICAAAAIADDDRAAQQPAKVADDMNRCLRNVYEHIQHEAYNDALSSILEAQALLAAQEVPK